MRRRASEPIRRLEGEVCRALPQVDIQMLQQLWQHDDIVLHCARPSGLEDQPDLAQRFRGALGNALEALCAYPSARPDPFDRECPHELFYFWRSPTIDSCFGRTEVAVPMIIRADMTSRSVQITIRLFGRAGMHRPMIETAAVRALEGGVSLRNHAIRVPIPVERLAWKRFDGGENDWLSGASAITMRYRTPVIIRSGSKLRLDPEAVLRSSLRRVAALAPWMAFELEADSAALNKCIDNLAYQIEIHPEKWSRTTSRKPGEPMSIFGYGGSMTVSGPLNPILPYIEIGAICSIGGECASGFGANDIIAYP